MAGEMQEPPLVPVRVALLEGNSARHETRWVNPRKVIAVVPGSEGGFSLHVEEFGRWQGAGALETALERLSASLVRVRVALLEGNRPKHETRWVNPGRVIAVVPDGEGSFSLHVCELGRWQCVEDSAKFLRRMAAPRDR